MNNNPVLVPFEDLRTITLLGIDLKVCTLPTYKVICLICIAQFRDSRNRIEMATTFEVYTIN